MQNKFIYPIKIILDLNLLLHTVVYLIIYLLFACFSFNFQLESKNFVSATKKPT